MREDNYLRTFARMVVNHTLQCRPIDGIVFRASSRIAQNSTRSPDFLSDFECWGLNVCIITPGDLFATIILPGLSSFFCGHGGTS